MTKQSTPANLDPTSEWSDDYISEHAYLVARGLRPMAIVGHVKTDDLLMLQVASKLEIATCNINVIPFVIPRKDDFADCGFAAATWVLELYAYIVQSGDIPDKHMHRIRGLLLGYSAEAIRQHDERTSGRQFISLESQASK
jgi:hypothetical protein